MTDRKKDLLFLAALLALLILFFSHILFTGKIIRAPDITNEFYWGIRNYWDSNLLDLLKIPLKASWNFLQNSGTTNEGGTESGQFLVYQRLIFHFFPPPSNVAWFIVLQLFFGSAGTYCYCRLIGASRVSAFFGGLIFAVAPENASLINAGHVMKIATISFAPWAFYFFEKGLQTRRVIFFLTTGFVLAFQFFNIHWQIAYYTCLGLGVYGLIRTIGIILQERSSGKSDVSRLLCLNLVTLVFFLSTVAISLAPLASWSKGTNRGVQSGANQGKGGLDRDEAMSWSFPPEEIASFVIPGFFGLSRQEGGENPTNILSYYWGRMHFTQTTDYMGLLPWLLLPLPLIFRRDKYTWLALAAIVGGIIFSMGKYSFVYNLLFDYFPGINRFRVPKMMMFIPVLGLVVLTARGLDLLLDDEVRNTINFKRYLFGLLSLPVLLLALLGVELAGKDYWINTFAEWMGQPTRYEQGPQLIFQRWDNLVVETGFAFGIAVLYAMAVFAYSRKWLSVKVIPLVLLVFYLADVGRVNAKFMFLVDEPEKAKGGKTPITEFLAKESKQFRVLPMEGSDPMQYATNGIPVMFTSNPVQLQRWQQILDSFSIGSPMMDMLNVKYLVMAGQEYQKQKSQMSGKYAPVFTTPDGSSVVLENRTVLPKAWIVPSAALVMDDSRRLAILQDPGFPPLSVALVESQPPLAMANPNDVVQPLPQKVTVPLYEGEHIIVEAATPANALLVLGEKYYKGWKASVDGKPAEIVPVNHILRGVYLTPGSHKVEFRFDPLPFKIGKSLTLASFALFAGMLMREWLLRSRRVKGEG
ncbi:MAG TPA: YfhO family protein [Dongiaceae bacterium]|nr:YfhO family protein [Dongiaceae bacterium]